MMSELRLKGEFFSKKILGNKKGKGQNSKEVRWQQETSRSTYNIKEIVEVGQSR